ncbi:hypothetical protein [Aquidulcibacter sp.]|jgi:hypothetical protein|uniref:hypothetical protein n=1 Tax=Aquidulcibacter sp. TaxID=2052990 RepID=UPI0037BF91CF
MLFMAARLTHQKRFYGMSLAAVALTYLGACSLSATPATANREVENGRDKNEMSISVENTSGGMSSTSALQLSVPIENLIEFPKTSNVRGLGLAFLSPAGRRVECGLIFGGIPTGGRWGMDDVPGRPVDRNLSAIRAGFPSLDCYEGSFDARSGFAVTNCEVLRSAQLFQPSSPLIIQSTMLNNVLNDYVTADIYVGREQHMSCKFPRTEVLELPKFEAETAKAVASWAQD